MKAKDTDIVILIYSYAVYQPKHNWYMQTDKDSFVNIRKIHEKFDYSVYLLLLIESYAIKGCDTVSYFFNILKRVLFERTSLSVTSFNMLVGLGASNIIAESINNEMKKLEA